MISTLQASHKWKGLTDSTPRSIPFRLLDLGPQISQRDGELVVDFLVTGFRQRIGIVRDCAEHSPR